MWGDGQQALAAPPITAKEDMTKHRVRGCEEKATEVSIVRVSPVLDVLE